MKMTRKATMHTTLQFQLGFLIVFSKFFCILGQNYEVADIDCAVGTGGKELLTARLRRPDGFRGTPIFADDRGQLSKEPLPIIVPQDLTEDLPCQIMPDPTDSSGRVFKLHITDFSQCGVMKRNGFIHCRIWFPQLPGVVMLSDQEVIIMCKPPAATIVQSKTAGFAGSIPSGARISGIVEESPGRLEYEVALYRETATSSGLAARSSNSAAYITGVDSHELPVDQAVPIGTRLQLRAKINPDSAWKHAKLMEVSVSPDPKNPNADGSVSLVRDGCRNPDLASIIPKQPYRYKERTNEVVLDFEAFLLSNMADRSTLWLHTQIKACMESQDCHPEFCMDVYQPSGYGRRRRRNIINGHPMGATSSISTSKSNATSMDYSAPLSQHWTAFADEIILDNEPNEERIETTRSNKNNTHMKTLDELLSSINGAHGSIEQDPLGLQSLPIPSETATKSGNVHKEDIDTTMRKYLPKNPPTTTFRSTTKAPIGKNGKSEGSDSGSTNFGDNIGFSVIMPSDYYRSTNVLSSSYECRGWATVTLVSLLAAVACTLIACAMGYNMKRSGSSAKEKALYTSQSLGPFANVVRTHIKDDVQTVPKMRDSGGHLFSHKYARDASIYRS